MWKELLRPYYLRWLYFPLRPDARPGYFLKPWTVPHAPLSQAAALFPSPRPARTFLFLSMTDWHTRTQRTQQFASELARQGHFCIYLNPHLGREFPNPGAQQPQVGKLADNIAELHVHLRREPVYHQRLLTAKENFQIVNAIQNLIQTLDCRHVTQIVSFPLWWPVARRINAPIVYDCHDRLSGFSNMAPEIVATEAECLANADLCVFSSAALQTSAVKRSILLRNAVDPAHFPLQENLKGRPIIGYIGALDSWFDADAVDYAAVRRPDWSFELIGRVESLALPPRSNIHLRGEIPYGQLPPEMSKFKVGLIPFLRNDLTTATNPIKLYEYFSAGLPVVSARLPEVERYADLVYFYDDPASFEAQLVNALAEDDPTLRQQRRQVAEAESWTARTAALLNALPNSDPTT